MGKFAPKPKIPKPAITPDFAEQRRIEESDKAAGRLRSSEKRRRGRRASVLSNTSKEEALAASVERPAGRAAKILFGG